MKDLKFLVAKINEEDRLLVAAENGLTLEFVDNKWEVSAFMYSFIERGYEYNLISFEQAMKITNNITPEEEFRKCGWLLD